MVELARGLARDALRRPKGFDDAHPDDSHFDAPTFDDAHFDNPNFDDTFIEWLLFTNAGMQHRCNVNLFDFAIRIAPGAPMLEIGSFCGLSTNIIQYLKRKHGRGEPLFTCDAWIFEGYGAPLPAAASVSHDEIREFVRSSFERSMRHFNGEDLPHTIEATSDEFFARWSEHAQADDVFGRSVRLGGPLSFCFVDGNHTEEYAQRDFEHCDQYLVEGGLILFDDSSPESPGEVSKVMGRIERSSRYEIVARVPNYLVRKKA